LEVEKLATEQRAAEQAETFKLRELTEANAALSVRVLQVAHDAAAAEDDLRAVRSETEHTQRLAPLEEINLVQTESLRQQLRALGKL
jgi:hypothetical protein